MKACMALIFKGILCLVDSTSPARLINLLQSQLVHIKVNYLGCAKGPANISEQDPLMWFSHAKERGITAGQLRSKNWPVPGRG